MSSKEDRPVPVKLVLGRGVTKERCLLLARRLDFESVIDILDMPDDLAFLWLCQEHYVTCGYGFYWLTRMGMDWLENEVREDHS